MGEKKEILMKEPFGTAVDDACDLDRKFFEEHPTRTNYVRKSVPFEHGMEALHLVYTHVVQFEPGVRVRVALTQKDNLVKSARMRGLSVRNLVLAVVKDGKQTDDKDWCQRFDPPQN